MTDANALPGNPVVTRSVAPRMTDHRKQQQMKPSSDVLPFMVRTKYTPPASDRPIQIVQILHCISEIAPIGPRKHIVNVILRGQFRDRCR
jgi:hypothetical protein